MSSIATEVVDDDYINVILDHGLNGQVIGTPPGGIILVCDYMRKTN